MRSAFRIALTVALGMFSALSADAQVAQQTFAYSDRDGTGTLTAGFTSLGSNTSRVQIVLEQNGRRLQGSGVQHLLDRGEYLLDFVLQDSRGGVWFYQGSGMAGVGSRASGIYFPVAFPQATVEWKIEDNGGSPTPNPAAIVNNTPGVGGTWTRNSSSDAPGGFYYSALNTPGAADVYAQWIGALPQSPQRFQVDVFIPAPPFGVTARTNSAQYIIYLGGRNDANAAVTRVVNQQVSSSQWVTLGTFDFSRSQGQYWVDLPALTSEPAGTRSVVAAAVRLIPVPNTGSGSP